MLKWVTVIANAGKRCLCRCIKTMDIIIGREKRILFQKGQAYDCSIRDNGNLQVNYKIYGPEFDLSCTDVEFRQNFVLIKNKKTGIKR